MFIAIVGTRGAGKSTVETYLVSKGFISVRLARADLVEVSPLRLSPPGGFPLRPGIA